MLWSYAAQNPERAYMAQCPTLGEYGVLYGEECPAFWIRIQITALFGSSGSREKGMADGIKLFAESFAEMARNYKLSELMLFFARYKAGKYDNSFASFDPKRIGNAFFKEFLPERVYEVDKAERKRVQQEIEERRFTPPEGYTSLSWYQELRRRADNGDTMAQEMIHPK